MTVRQTHARNSELLSDNFSHFLHHRHLKLRQEVANVFLAVMQFFSSSSLLLCVIVHLPKFKQYDITTESCFDMLARAPFLLT